MNIKVFGLVLAKLCADKWKKGQLWLSISPCLIAYLYNIKCTLVGED